VRVLGLDTATRATTVAVLDTETGRSFERRDDPPAGERPRHTTRLLGLAADALDDAGTRWDQLDRIAVGTGPGTFTGIRIGVASARALAATLEIAIVPVSTLQALAARALGELPDELEGVLAVLDARRREVFAAAWPRDQAGEAGAAPVLGPAALAPAALAEQLAADGRAWLAVGDGAVASRAALEAVGATVPDDASWLHEVIAIEICRLGVELPPQTPAEIVPEYLRLPDAELNRRAAQEPPR
jgi:tRNA threonylcarbamoyladenosine biosynthesis protein TsaB